MLCSAKCQSISRDRLPVSHLVTPYYNCHQLDYGLTYGIAAAEAYGAYKDDAFLGWAETTWNSARPFIISDNDVQSGRALGKSTVVQKGCSGASLAGGGFWASRFYTFTLMAIDVVSVLLAN
ncbi:hypothetical protein PQX77_018861 [Marasmius sp. AFHP31]|nr:hypothetical protein PQX77_018861 [Marasmius sp. AFHP31]